MQIAVVPVAEHLPGRIAKRYAVSFAIYGLDGQVRVGPIVVDDCLTVFGMFPFGIEITLAKYEGVAGYLIASQ